MSKDPGYSDSKRDALESKVRQYQSTILELQGQALVLGKLKAENAKLRECVELIAGDQEFYCEVGDANKQAYARQVLKELDENK